jgi:hypothetical protein
LTGHLIDAEDSDGLVVASGDELPPGGRVRHVEHGGRVVHVHVQRPPKVAQVERVYVVVLASVELFLKYLRKNNGPKIGVFTQIHMQKKI